MAKNLGVLADGLAAGAVAGMLAALLLAGGAAHVGLSLGWGTVLAVAVRRLSLAPVTAGVVAGAAIAGVVLRRRG